MSSIPRPLPQRTPSSNEASSAASEASAEQPSQSEPQSQQSWQSVRKDSLSKSTSSVDSQTLLLNNPSAQDQSSASKAAASTQPETTSEEPQKCWICFADETEDSPTTSRWRSPCSCKLTAHESCLLDWVADLEAPNSRRRAGTPAKIQCPQCKKDIKIARPKNYVVEGVKRADRAVSRLVVPGIAMTLISSLYWGATVHGATTILLVFGRKDFHTLLGEPDRIGWKWFVGFPTIPVALIMSRTSLANGVLPTLPAIFFASNIPPRRLFQNPEQSLWPPSAAMTIAMLPWVRAVYNALYRRLFAEREQRWLKEVQPRAGEAEEAGGINGENHNHDDFEFNWNLELEIVDEHVHDPPEERQEQLERDAENQDQNDAQEPPRGGNARQPPIRNGDNGENREEDRDENEGQNNNEGQPENQPANQQENRQQGGIRQHPLVLTTSRIADAVMGALVFPAVASAMGELLKLGLPRSWTETVSARRPGLLHTKWGRSVVGGCLFVVMKDTLTLYSRYRTARDHRLRRVMNYDKDKGKYVE